MKMRYSTLMSSTLLGIDLGGTKTLMGLYKADSLELIETKKFPTHAKQSFEHVRKDLLKYIDSVRDASLVGIGIGVPGLVNKKEKKIITMPNIPGAEGFNIEKFIADHAKVPVAVENDVHCFALGEALYGAGKGHTVVIGLTLGTGVGGGIIIDGQIFSGAHGFAGEIGHMLLMPGKPPYKTDDMRGEVEQFFSGTALGKRCTDAQSPTDYLQGDVCEFMHPALYKEISWLVASLTYAFDPSIIIFGGAVGRALESHLSEIQSELKNWILPHTPTPTLAIAERYDAAVLGAAVLAKRALK